MSNQNNMISFITLSDAYHPNKIELNPAFIVFMTRMETDKTTPYTRIVTTNNHILSVLETPEQIAEMQIEAVAKTIGTFMPIFTDVMEELD